MLREWLFSRLSTETSLVAMFGDRVYQSTSISDIPEVKPYLLYRFGTSSRGISGDDGISATVQPLQVFMHDIPGDYARIDEGLKLLRSALQGQFSTGGIIRCEWIEDSEDFLDDEMKTITRFGRYQITHK